MGIVDDTGLRAFLPDEDSTRRLMAVEARCACIRDAVGADGGLEIEAEVRKWPRPVRPFESEKLGQAGSPVVHFNL